MSSASVRIAWFAVLAASLQAADNAQLLTEFRKTKPDASQVHVLAEEPLLVAVTGEDGWGKGELLGVFAHRGDQIVPISVLPNGDYPSEIRIDRQTDHSISLALADPEGEVKSDDLKIFFDPKTLFPRRIVRFAPVHVRRIAVTAGVTTVIGSDGKQDFAAREQNGVWRVTAGPATQPVPSPPLESVAQIAPMPVSTLGEFEKARSAQAKLTPDGAVIEERIGPYQKVGSKIWVGKTFYNTDSSVGVGDIGYYDQATKDWVFLHIPEMADWSTSALLIEANTIWAGLESNNPGGALSGGLLRYDRMSHKTTTIPLSDVIEKIIVLGQRVYCGTTGGFAVIEHDQARRFEFEPQIDGSYTVTPAP
jgi:hypothetical protein